MNKIYQVITVSHTQFSNSVIPDQYAFTSQFEAEMDIKNRIVAFAKNGEILNFNGVIKSVDDIFDIYKEYVNVEYCDAYIYEVEIR